MSKNNKIILLNFFVEKHPSFIKVFVKIGFVAGKFVALETILKLFFLMTNPDTAFFKEFALFIAASLAVF